MPGWQYAVADIVVESLSLCTVDGLSLQPWNMNVLLVLDEGTLLIGNGAELLVMDKLESLSSAPPKLRRKVQFPGNITRVSRHKTLARAALVTLSRGSVELLIFDEYGRCTSASYSTGESAWGCHGQHSILAASSNDWRVRVWNTEEPAEPVILEGHSHNIPSIEVSPDGHYLVSASIDRTCRLWSLDTGAQVASYSGGGGWGWSAHFVDCSSSAYSLKGSVWRERRIRDIVVPSTQGPPLDLFSSQLNAPASLPGLSEFIEDDYIGAQTPESGLLPAGDGGLVLTGRLVFEILPSRSIDGATGLVLQPDSEQPSEGSGGSISTGAVPLTLPVRILNAAQAHEKQERADGAAVLKEPLMVVFLTDHSLCLLRIGEQGGVSEVLRRPRLLLQSVLPDQRALLANESLAWPLDRLAYSQLLDDIGCLLVADQMGFLLIVRLVIPKGPRSSSADVEAKCIVIPSADQAPISPLAGFATRRLCPGCHVVSMLRLDSTLETFVLRNVSLFDRS